MRKFHEGVPDHTFVFHVRNDLPYKKQKNGVGDVVNLHAGTRSATIVIMTTNIQNRPVVMLGYGIARCEWQYQFSRKVARSVAMGRAKKALFDPEATWRPWFESGTSEVILPTDKSSMLEFARKKATELVLALNNRAREIDTKRPVRKK